MSTVHFAQKLDPKKRFKKRIQRFHRQLTITLKLQKKNEFCSIKNAPPGKGEAQKTRASDQAAGVPVSVVSPPEGGGSTPESDPPEAGTEG